MKNLKGTRLVGLDVTVMQEPDSCSEAKLPQELTVSVVDAGAGPYLVLRSERWALCRADLEDLRDWLDSMIAEVEPMWGDHADS